ncbi:NACHT domain-containing protein [Phormidesmis priestleyi ULC007]|uniref:NACHT domain-containing protein n=1 Tax=Phormidesmis priestleyi ULC007 TaxID=1920490 RepID=A0A2T1D1U5_9CYAN|nr:NACHT domain-containing protein [Phormidesmis priestleyi]PSB14473.1 NACHT domain-containing protein [Phormidesmis priestleyi ULC007]PZO45506.1 MAG: NACHT domain-containing protein [Phormidesmis priestleyi]
MIPDFQPYLESIRAAYAKWWQLYTLTDAQGKQRQSKDVSPFFDFGLTVQTVKREEREEREAEKVERFPVLEGIRKYADQQVLLVGQPGSGKSRALARLMLEEATKPQAKIPVLVELRYWQRSIEELIRSSFARHELRVESLELVLARSLLLFDGVNELPSEEARSQLSTFRRNHPKLPMIFTTRDLSLGGDLGIEQKLEMQPLTEAQMQAFVRSYVPEQAEEMLRQLKDRLREFGQTPLLLWMLCSLFQQTGQIPKNLGMVFREFTQGYERYLKEDARIESDRTWWKPVLQQLAWVMMQGEKPTEFRVAISKEEAVRAIAQFLNEKVPFAEDFARKCLRDLQKHHLIQAGTNSEELEFRHQLIQEHYAAEALLEQLPKLEPKTLQRDFLNFLKWTEPVALMLACLDEELAEKIVELALEVDSRLGARLAGEVKSELQKITVSKIDILEVPKWLKIKLLGETRSSLVISTLLQEPKDETGTISNKVACALKLIDQAITSPECAEAIALYIEIHESDYSMEPLKLPDEDATDWQTTEELVNLFANRPIPVLLKVLENDNEQVRWIAAITLGKLNAVEAVPELLKSLKNLSRNARQMTFEVLEQFESQILPALLEVLEDESRYLQQQSALKPGKQILCALPWSNVRRIIMGSVFIYVRV